ncbi:hypothetical protein STEG23_036671, partial [Scotinomys teguina]
ALIMGMECCLRMSRRRRDEGKEEKAFNHTQNTGFNLEGIMIENVTLELNSLLSACKTYVFRSVVPQDIKIETEKLKKTLSEGMLEIEKLSKRSGNTDASITNRIQEMEDRISNVEDTIEEIDSTVKENTKTKKAIKQNVQEIWDTMKRPNIRIIGIEEGEEYQLKGTENIFNKIIEENFPNLKRNHPSRYKKLIEHQTD